MVKKNKYVITATVYDETRRPRWKREVMTDKMSLIQVRSTLKVIKKENENMALKVGRMKNPRIKKVE